jgi:fermentation-respiration switch protein FrsA (DUF1100 family)
LQGPAVLFLHGNGENLQTMHQAGLFEDLKGLGLPFLAIDYPGYGRSFGEPSEAGLVRSAESGAEWLRRKHPGRPLAFCGWSLGAAVAVQAAGRSQPDGLILLSAWSRLADVAKVHYPDWMVKLLLRERYDSLEAAERIRCRVLLVHGERDSIIPPEQGRLLFGRFPVPPAWVAVPDADHNDLLSRSIVWEEIGKFLASFDKRENPQ